jgi:hypothetical protein
MVNELMDTFEISPVNRDVLRATLQLEIKDFEDAVQIASAQAEELDFIITRDVEDYEKSPVKALTPIGFVVQLG